MPNPLVRSIQFADALQHKFDGEEHATDRYTTIWRYHFWVEAGRRFDRIMCESWIDGSGSPGQSSRVYAFVDRLTLGVLKPEGYKKPATRLGYYEPKYDLSDLAGFKEALFNADPYGSFLYADYQKKEPQNV